MDDKTAFGWESITEFLEILFKVLGCLYPLNLFKNSMKGFSIRAFGRNLK